MFVRVTHSGVKERYPELNDVTRRLVMLYSILFHKVGLLGTFRSYCWILYENSYYYRIIFGVVNGCFDPFCVENIKLILELLD